MASAVAEAYGTFRGTSSEKMQPRAEVLFHPIVDFLCLGGLSLIVLPLLLVLPPMDGLYAQVVTVSLILNYVLNQPHFAHSYQLFYFNFGKKSFGQEYAPLLRARYVLAGIIVPAGMIVFFIVSIAIGDVQMLAYGANIMLLLVGWHYVKQGYGMIIVDSVLKRRFFTQSEKKILLINAYSCWLLYWLLLNWMFSEHNLWGLTYYTFAIPNTLVYAAACITAITTVTMLYMLFNKCLSKKNSLPFNGVVAYFATLYAWVLIGFLNPLLLLMVPAFHALQYLTVVWRYQLNLDRARPDAAEKPGPKLLARYVPSKALARFLGFAASGFILGYIGFHGAPMLLSSVISYDQEIFGGALIFFVFWTFINVHHYFLDNVIWRRGNPDVQKHLFT